MSRWLSGTRRGSFLEPLCEQTRQLVVGPGDQPGVDVGPLIRAEHRDRVAHYVDQGVAEGRDAPR